MNVAGHDSVGTARTHGFYALKGRVTRLCPPYGDMELRREPRTVVRRGEVDRRPLGDDAGRIELPDRVITNHVVARLHGRGDARHRVELAHVVRQVGIVGDAFPVALE